MNRIINEKYRNYDKILTLLVLAYYFCNIIYEYFPVNEQFCFYLGWGFSVLAFFISLKGRKICVKEVVLYYCITVCNFFSLSYAGNASFGMLITALSYYFIAMVLIRIRLVPKYILINYCFWVVFFIVNMIKNPLAPFTGIGKSQNFISVVLMIYVFLFIYSSWNKRRNCLFVIISALVLSIWTGCRSAIIALAFLLVSYIVTTNSKHRKGFVINVKKLMGFFIFILCFYIFIVFVLKKIDIDSFLFLLIRPRASIKGNVRFEMLHDYLMIVSNHIGNLFLGVNLKSIPSIAEYNGNPHNSFVFAHANYGFLFLGILLLGGIFLLNNPCKYKKIYLILLITLLLRSFSDSVAFPGYFDSFFYLILFEVNFSIENKYYRKGLRTCIFTVQKPLKPLLVVE